MTTVDNTGKITAKAEGKAVITASVGEVAAAECEIIVTAAQYGDKFDTGDRSLALTAVRCLGGWWNCRYAQRKRGFKRPFHVKADWLIAILFLQDEK